MSERPAEERDAARVEPIRVFCVDDDAGTAAYYRIAIDGEPDMRCAGVQTTLVGLDDALERARPTLLLVDLRIPGEDPLAAIREVKRRHPELAVAVVSGFSDDDHVRAAERAGADGFLVKGLDLDELLGRIRRFAAGERGVLGPGR